MYDEIKEIRTEAGHTFRVGDIVRYEYSHEKMVEKISRIVWYGFIDSSFKFIFKSARAGLSRADRIRPANDREKFLYYICNQDAVELNDS